MQRELSALTWDALVSKGELLEAVWPGTHVSDTVVKVCVREIREALGDAPRRPRYVETVSRRGYRFIATDNQLNIVLDGGETPFGDKNPILNGLTLRQIVPEPATAMLGGLGLAGLIWRRRR